MRFTKSIHAVDSHTMGEPTRIIVGGLPPIKGNTMAEKKQYLIDNLDNVRTSLMHEPRGHLDMFGSIITDPCNKDADFGIIFMDGGGYLNMCGHGSIGAVTVAIETGIIEFKSPVTNVVMDTPAGLVSAEAFVDKTGKVTEVSIVNVPSFCYKQDVKVKLKDKEITLDVSFGGSFFAIVDAKEIGLEVKPSNINKITEIAMEIMSEANKQIEIKHPELEHIKTIDLVEIYDKPSHKDADYKNVVIFGEGQADRSPCGTGTSAKMATLHAKGKLKTKENFVYESIIGTLFKGKILEETKIGEFAGVIPQITASAFITGFNHFVVDPIDPLKDGFIVK